MGCVIEVATYLGGIWIYLEATKAWGAAGRWGLLALAAFLLVGFLASSAPPPSVTALWATAIDIAVLIRRLGVLGRSAQERRR
jgi:multidrug efflux pump subunit AcrA (membrane-fusion protein)